VIRDAAAAGTRHVSLQRGAESPETVRVGAELGLDVIAGERILMFAQPKGTTCTAGCGRSRSAYPAELRT
jgi:hypothetical protein